MPFLVAAALGAVIWLFACLEIPRYARNAPAPLAASSSVTRNDSRSVDVLLLLTLLMMFGLGSFEVGLTLHGQQKLSFGPERLSQMFVACMLVMIATQGLVFPFLIRRWPVHVIAPAAFAVMAAGLMLVLAWHAIGK